jgi:hypothetical protein
MTTATQNGPDPRAYQAEWMAARLEGKPMPNERWFVQSSGNITKENIA